MAEIFNSREKKEKLESVNKPKQTYKKRPLKKSDFSETLNKEEEERIKKNFK